jgi:hypothetical protein
MHMATNEDKDTLHQYLGEGRTALRWKLEGLGEYDLRRPLTPTGTNLLGLVKHVASMEALYFGEVFDLPFGESLPWLGDEAESNADFWATTEESAQDIIGFYDRACAHADATIAALDLHAIGHVRWWGGAEVTLHKILVHMVAETHRHAGHADIVRELVDGEVGILPDDSNMVDEDEAWWAGYLERLEATARAAGSA